MLVYSKNPEYVVPHLRDNYIIGEATQNCNLDIDNGASAGCHSGIEFFEEKNQFIMIKTSDYQGSENYAYLVSDKEATQEIVRAGKKRLFEKKEFERLNK
jgi:hypothetical protein